MQIKHIEGATRHLGAPENWDGDLVKCNVLPILDTEQEGIAFMVSAWEPSPAELERIKAGAAIFLWIAGRSHPVVAMSVGENA